MANAEPKSGLARRLGVLDASSIVIGSMIGSGIFIAAVAIAFSKYLGIFFPFLGETNKLFSIDLFGKTLSLSTAQVSAILCIMLLTAVNIRGVRAGAALQNIFTVTKVAAMLALILAAFFFFKGSFRNFTPLLKPVLPAAASLPLFAALAVAMSKALFAYDSWNSVAFVAEEAFPTEEYL